jgi:hypothetical protein
MSRATMAALITRVRLLINDPAGTSPQFSDDEIEQVLDASRQDVFNGPLEPKPTYTGSTIEYLDYFASLGDWEDDAVLKQFLTITVTPSLSEPIVGHWQFSTTTLPSVFITGKVYDVYRAAADLLERWAARWALSYDAGVDGQTLRRSQAGAALLSLAKQYRMQQRAFTIDMSRSDTNADKTTSFGLGATELDYMGSGGHS